MISHGAVESSDRSRERIYLAPPTNVRATLSTMNLSLVNLLVVLVCLEHIGFFILEAVLWTRPLGRRIFRLTPELAEATRGLAANQGLYNLFLSAGLAWSLFAATEFVRPLQIFFLGCVLLAGVFGAFTVSIRILFVQAVPAAVALALIFGFAFGP